MVGARAQSDLERFDRRFVTHWHIEGFGEFFRPSQIVFTAARKAAEYRDPQRPPQHPGWQGREPEPRRWLRVDRTLRPSNTKYPATFLVFFRWVGESMPVES
jgi:hypothetical protein